MAHVWIIAFLTSTFYLNTSGYSCKNKTCIVNCTSTPTICSNSIINGNETLSLNIFCNGDSICNNVVINCPQNENASNCNLICNGNYACNNITFSTLNSNSSIKCGNNPNIATTTTLSICSNITISSLPLSLPLSLSLSPNITIECLLSNTKSTCQNILLENITSKNLFIICDSLISINNNNNNITCTNFTIKNNTFTSFSIYNYIGIKNIYITDTFVDLFAINNYHLLSDLYIENNKINEFNIYNYAYGIIYNMNTANEVVSKLINNGIINNTEINQFENITIGSFGKLISSSISSLNINNYLNIYSSAQIISCLFTLIQDINHINNTLTLFHNGLFLNNTLNIHAHVYMIINGKFEYNFINLTANNNDFMNVLTIKLNQSSIWRNNTINAYFTQLLDIKTQSLFSGVIYANNTCDNFTLQCSNKIDMVDTCKNLTLFLTPMYQHFYHTYLDCIGYGCQYLSIYSLNGLNDIHLSVSQCPCTIDCIENCVSEWNVYCSNISDYNSTLIRYDVHSLFTNDECYPDYCCGDVVNKTEDYLVCSPNIYENVYCKHNVGLDIALIASLAMAGVMLFFFIFLALRYVYRKVKKTTKIKQFEKQKQMEHEKQNKVKRTQKIKKKIKPQKLQRLAQEPLLENENANVSSSTAPDIDPAN